MTTIKPISDTLRVFKRISLSASYRLPRRSIISKYYYSTLSLLKNKKYKGISHEVDIQLSIRGPYVYGETSDSRVPSRFFGIDKYHVNIDDNFRLVI